MDRLGFNSGNSGILESTREYSGITWGSYGNDSGMTREYLGDSGRVQDMTSIHILLPPCAYHPSSPTCAPHLHPVPSALHPIIQTTLFSSPVLTIVFSLHPRPSFLSIHIPANQLLIVSSSSSVSYAFTIQLMMLSFVPVLLLFLYSNSKICFIPT